MNDLKKQSFVWLWAGMIFLLLMFFRIFSGFEGLYGQDAYEYERYSSALTRWIAGGRDPGAFFWPGVYPMAGALLGFILPGAFALQLISILAHTFTVYFLVRILEREYPRLSGHAGLFAFLTCGLSPWLLRSSLLTMSDSLAVFFLVFAFDQAMRYRSSQRIPNFILFSLASGLGVFTRYGNAIPMMIPAVIVISQGIRSGKYLHLLISLAGLVPGLLVHFLLKRDSPTGFLSHPWLTEWSPLNFFSRTFTTPDGTNTYPVPNAVQLLFPFFHPACFAMGIPLLVFLKFRESFSALQKLSLAVILLYVLFLCGMPIQNQRFLIPVIPFAAMFFYPAWIRLMEWKNDRQTAGGYKIAGVIIIQFVFIFLASRKLTAHLMFEKEVLAEIKQHHYGSVCSIGWEGAIEYHLPGVDYLDLFSGDADSLNQADAFLVNETVIASQWKGKKPEANWKKIRETLKLKQVWSTDKGWRIYEKE